MVIELTTDNVLVIAGLFGTFTTSLLGYWMKSVSAQNKELKKELDELSESLQDTRENYVTNAKFDKAMDKVDAKLDKIMNSLSTSTFGRRKDDHNG